MQAEACTFNKKENLAQLFSCEFWEISKNTFSYKTPPVAASEDAIFYLLSLQKKMKFSIKDFLKKNFFSLNLKFVSFSD